MPAIICAMPKYRLGDRNASNGCHPTDRRSHMSGTPLKRPKPRAEAVEHGANGNADTPSGGHVAAHCHRTDTVR